MSINKDSFILEDKTEIADFIAKISYDMYEYIQSKPQSKFVMFYKYLTHSDLATFGKATKINSLDKNLLYYIDVQEMKSIEERTNKPFQTAHQSCIGLKKDLYTLIGLPDPRDVDPYLINDYMDVLLINQNIKYFTSEYTQLVFEKLNKQAKGRNYKNFNDLNVSLDNNAKYTSINLHVAVHGLGMEQDTDFHKLRHHMFKGDTFILLCELSSEGNKMFIVLEKNPAFFSIIGESNNAYEEYQHKLRARQIAQVTQKDNAVEEGQVDAVTRQQQAAWRRMLANEMMGYTQVNDQVFCPLTYITANFDQLGALFVASHIKGFSDKATTDDEKYDINNGLLLCANADALFDKHLITINQDKELEFSFLLDNDIRLKQQLLLLQPIFKPILNEKRMQYLAYHKSIFELKEQMRRRP